VSIVRVGMAEDGKFGDGYEAIFGKKKAGSKPSKKSETHKKSKTAKKSGAKKK
jgi:hypothetical protein